MKNSGIIRRIDDLGRIVIPEEIRRRLRVKEGMPFEINVDENGSIILTPYLTKAEKLIKWMDTILIIMDRDLDEVEFYFHGSAIVCVRKEGYQFFSEGVGIAVCSPNDDYDEIIGKCIAYSRAAGMAIPDFIFED
ncbi:MAG: AbrB/MazE/SpoVT family DNA-binding domain-containing protein [Clostridiales bacterium]